MGLAFGLASCCVNICFSTFPLLYGSIYDNSLDTYYGYFYPILVLMFLNAIPLGLMIWLYVIDRAQGSRLNNDKIKWNKEQNEDEIGPEKEVELQ